MFWALSFFFGTHYLKYVSSTLYANIVLLKIRRGEEPSLGNNRAAMAAAAEGVMDAINSNVKKASRFGNLQSSFFIIGVLTYVVWQLLEMYLRFLN